jgi:hypothetical protein
VFAQSAFGSQVLPPPAAHSSMSVQDFPSWPVNPFLHAQLKPGDRFVQSALTSQSFAPVEHSSMSLHVVPSPSNPGRHVHVCVAALHVAWTSHTTLPQAVPPSPGT